MDLTRLVDSDEDRFEARLLGSARDDAPPRGALSRAEVALGFGVSAGMLATTAAASTAKAATAHLGAAHTVAQFGVASVLKWVGIGLVSGVVVTGGLSYGVSSVLPAPEVRPPTTSNDAPLQIRKAASKVDVPRPAQGASGAASEPSPLVPLPPPAVQPRIEPKAVALTPPTRSASASPAALGAVGAPTERVVPAPSLSTELAVLERARHALLAQRPDVALQELDAYRRTRSTGVFDAEADVLEIEAFVQQGNLRVARARALRSLEHAPDGPHAARLREIVAIGKP